jgi:3-deoxy-manno-octulosonate cytidylyltransferase (CMP-KDO synthetase)
MGSACPEEARRAVPKGADPVRVDCILPARLSSTRFPGKPLALVAGVPLVVRAARQALAAGCFARVAVACEDREIASVCGECGIEALVTPQFPTGTDRVAWAARQMGSQWVVNLQGDEPLFPPEVLTEIVKLLPSCPEALWTCAEGSPLTEEDLTDPDIVKIRLEDLTGTVTEALDFHRALPPELVAASRVHVGLYAGRREVLERFASLPQTAREEARRIEPLRALDNGMRVRALVRDIPRIAVDRPEHIDQVERRLAGM